MTDPIIPIVSFHLSAGGDIDRERKVISGYLELNPGNVRAITARQAELAREDGCHNEDHLNEAIEETCQRQADEIAALRAQVQNMAASPEADRLRAELDRQGKAHHEARERFKAEIQKVRDDLKAMKERAKTAENEISQADVERFEGGTFPFWYNKAKMYQDELRKISIIVSAEVGDHGHCEGIAGCAERIVRERDAATARAEAAERELSGHREASARPIEVEQEANARIN